MISSTRLRVLVEPVDVRVELRPVDSPDASTTDLDGRKVPGSDQRVDLSDSHVEIRSNVLESKEARFDAGGSVPLLRFLCSGRHGFRITRGAHTLMALNAFAAFWPVMDVRP